MRQSSKVETTILYWIKGKDFGDRCFMWIKKTKVESAGFVISESRKNEPLSALWPECSGSRSERQSSLAEEVE